MSAPPGVVSITLYWVVSEISWLLQVTRNFFGRIYILLLFSLLHACYYSSYFSTFLLDLLLFLKSNLYSFLHIFNQPKSGTGMIVNLPILMIWYKNVVVFSFYTYKMNSDDTSLALSIFGISLRGMIPPMVVHPEKIDFRRFV